MQLSKKQKLLSQLFALFLKFNSILNIYKKKMTFIAYVFLKFNAAKDLVK